MMKQQYNNMKALVWLFGCRRVRAVYALLGSDYPMARPLGVAVGDTIVQEADDDDLLPRAPIP